MVGDEKSKRRARSLVRRKEPGTSEPLGAAARLGPLQGAGLVVRRERGTGVGVEGGEGEGRCVVWRAP